MSKEEVLKLFKPGDFLARGNDWVFIFAGLEYRGPGNNAIRYHSLMSKTSGYNVIRTSIGIGCIEDAALRHATNQEKCKLLDCIKKRGFIWNEEHLRLEPILTEEEVELPF